MAKQIGPVPQSLTGRQTPGKVSEIMMERPRFLKGWTDAEPGPAHPLRGLVLLVILLGLLFVGLQGWWLLTPAPAITPERNSRRFDLAM